MQNGLEELNRKIKKKSEKLFMLHARFAAGSVNSLARMQAQATHPQCIHKVVGRQHALACKSLLCCLKYLCRRKQNATAGQDGPGPGQEGVGEAAGCILCLAAIFLAGDGCKSLA